jgi:protein SCO1/2
VEDPLGAAGPLRQAAALGALGAILVVTAAWWALALWPLDPGATAWLSRARAVCFGTGSSGLPNAGGWLLLLGEPPVMFATLALIGGDALRGGLTRLARSRTGVRWLATGIGLVLAGSIAAGVRISRLVATAGAGEPPEAWLERHDRPAPPVALVDQRGSRVTLAQLRGQPVLVGFAYAHCETVCPLLVREVVEARRAARSNPTLLLVTLDPWRDPPGRLPAIARHWGLSYPRERVLSGTVAEVEASLEQWQIPRGRDSLTGEISHVPGVYLVNRAGNLVYRAAGPVELIARLAAGL